MLRAHETCLILLLAIAGCGDDSGLGEAGSTTDVGSTGVGEGPGTAPGSSSASTSTSASATTSSVDETGSSESGEGSTTDTEGPAGCAMPGEPCGDWVVSTEIAQALIDDGTAIALDVRGAAAFTTEHLPGATVLSATDLRATVDDVAGQVAPPDASQAVFEAAGIAPEDGLVVYGDANGTDPARVVWTLAYYGHTGPIWMLDGGLTQWTDEGRPVQSDGAAAGGSSYAPEAVDALRVDAAWVLDHLDDPGVTLVDARSDAEYGDGHIPGALSMDWGRNLGPQGLFLPDDELRALYGDPDEGQTLVAYCQTGSRASVDWIALTKLGYADVRIYDGSWAEWSADPDNPVE